MKLISANTILIVDDNQQDLIILKTFLEEEGYQTILSSTGEKALSLVKEKNIDLILLDVMMPGISGFEVCRKIKFQLNRQELPIVLITSLEAREDRLKGLEAGADDFLTKPIDWAELIGRVRSLLRLKKAYDQLEEQINRLNYQLEMARGIQTALARVEMPAQLHGEIFYQPLEKIGGDIYDLFSLTEKRVGIFLGDSAGHGVPAALVMVVVKLILAHLPLKNLTPDQVLSQINQGLIKYFGNNTDGIFVTAVYLIIDLEKQLIFWANAGHPTPLLFNNNIKYQKLDSTNLPLGIITKLEFENQFIKYEKGANLFLCTDGLIDFLNPGESTFTNELIENLKKEITFSKSDGRSKLYHYLSDKPESVAEDDISFGLFYL